MSKPDRLLQQGQSIPKEGCRACALCRQISPLRNSHIIPEFLYETLYDEIHRFNTYGKEGLPILGMEQKGERERLLCDGCEKRFCQYENFACDFIRGGLAAFAETRPLVVSLSGQLKYTRIDALGSPTTEKVPTWIAVDGIDYAKLKLFFLSLIWRMGISKLHFFHEVDLGPHQAKIGKMLLNNHPGEPNEYPCEICLVEINERLLTDWQQQPHKYREGMKTFYRFIASGIMFTFWVTNQPIHSGMIELYCVQRKPSFLWSVNSIHKHPDLVAALIKTGYDLNWIPG